jgi:hypothetical protein
MKVRGGKAQVPIILDHLGEICHRYHPHASGTLDKQELQPYKLDSRVACEERFPFRCIQLSECSIVLSTETQVKLFDVTHNEGLLVSLLENNGDLREFEISRIEVVEGMKQRIVGCQTEYTHLRYVAHLQFDNHCIVTPPTT